MRNNTDTSINTRKRGFWSKLKNPKRLAFFVLLFALVVNTGFLGFGLPVSAYAQGSETISTTAKLGKVVATGEVNLKYVAPPVSPKSSGSLTTVINVNYNGFTTEAKNAFQYAVNIWKNYIVSPVPITINANWKALGSGILGSAGPHTFYRDFPNAPQAHTWYPVAVANKIANTDLNGSGAEIDANFSSVFPNWYFGTDGNAGSSRYDFATVVLHELGHGFGFLGSMDITDGLGNWGWDTGFPEVYDLYAINGAGQSLLNTSLFPNYSTALASQLKSNNIYLNGANAKSANGGTRVPIYAPSTWKPGSSYSHLAESYNGTSNALMTYSLSMGEAIHNPGPVTLGVLTDVGWNIQSKLSTTTTLTSSKNPSTPGQSVTLTAKVSTSSGTPTGTVTFKDGTTTLGTGSLSSGQAKFTTTSLSAGTHSITAVYGGSTGYLTSTSSTLKQVVNLLPLGTPGNLTATAIGSSSSSVVTVKLNWKDNSSAENRFYIERQLYWGGAWSVLGYVGANITTYTDTPPFGFVYNYRVRAWNTTAGYSAYSNVVNPASPNAPSNLTVVAKTNVQFTLNWKDNSTNETGFLIAYRDATKNGSWAYIKALYSPNTTTANLVGGTSGDVYQFAVVSVGPGGLSNFSNIASITAISSTGSQGASSLIQPENGVLDLNFQLPEITINS